MVWPVPPLSVPAGKRHALALAGLAGYEATRLFVERATTACPDVAWLTAMPPAVAAVCRRLDGMPLAIELAAARVRVLSVSQIADHLHERFRLLTSGSRGAPPRQQSLRAAIDWSYDLLDAEEQAMLRRLSIFVGEFSLAGAAPSTARVTTRPACSMCCRGWSTSHWSAPDAAATRRRYRLLDTIKLYAWEKAVAAGEKDALVQRYISYCAGLVSATCAS